MESTALTSGLHFADLGLPLDEEAYKCCKSLCQGENVVNELEREHNIMASLEELVTRNRFSGKISILLESGHYASLIVLDGVIFGACIEEPDGSIILGEKVLGILENIGGPAVIVFYKR